MSIDAHCLVCHALNVSDRARSGRESEAIGARMADAIIARALTVEASKAYALVHYRAELDAPPMRSQVSPDRDAPGAKQ